MAGCVRLVVDHKAGKMHDVRVTTMRKNKKYTVFEENDVPKPL